MKSKANGMSGPYQRCRVFLALAVFIVGCGGDQSDCGLVQGEVTVVFQEGTTARRVLEINSEIGATVVRFPILTTWYRIKLPSGISYDEAVKFYRSKPEVRSVMWAINFCSARVANTAFSIATTDATRSESDCCAHAGGSSKVRAFRSAAYRSG